MLFDTLILSNDSNLPFKDSLLRALFLKVGSKAHGLAYAEILSDILDEVDCNIDRVSPELKAVIARHLDQEYCQAIVAMVLAQVHTDQEHCEFLLQILTKIVDLYRRLGETQGLEIRPLQEGVIAIVKSMNALTNILKLPCDTQIPFPNGENVTVIGMLRYYGLELLHNVLQLEPKLVSAHYDLMQAGILAILEVRGGPCSDLHNHEPVEQPGPRAHLQHCGHADQQIRGLPGVQLRGQRRLPGLPHPNVQDARLCVPQHVRSP